jgi:hypothetical protein
MNGTLRRGLGDGWAADNASEWIAKEIGLWRRAFPL